MHERERTNDWACRILFLLLNAFIPHHIMPMPVRLNSTQSSHFSNYKITKCCCTKFSQMTFRLACRWYACNSVLLVFESNSAYTISTFEHTAFDCSGVLDSSCQWLCEWQIRNFTQHTIQMTQSFFQFHSPWPKNEKRAQFLHTFSIFAGQFSSIVVLSMATTVKIAHKIEIK